MPFVPEVFVDIEYTPDGKLIPPAKSKSMTPDDCAERVRMVVEQDRLPAQGSDKPTSAFNMQGRPFSVCCHSDMHGATENVAAVRRMIDQLNAKYFPFTA